MKKQLLKKTTSLLLAALLTTGVSIMPIQAAAGVPIAETISNPTFDDDGIGAYDMVYFGSSQNKPINWKVLDVDDSGNKVLLLQEESFIDKYFKAIDNWETSTLRTYLNAGFLSKLATYNDIGDEVLLNAIVNTDGDKVSLLTEKELEEYFANNEERKAFDLSGQSLRYWTRSPLTIVGHGYLVCVAEDGEISNYRGTYAIGVRPTLKINASGLFKSGLGTESEPYLTTGSADGKDIEIGNYVKFGNILWQVLDINDGVAKVISKNILEQKMFSELVQANQWKYSDIRALLNPDDGVFEDDIYLFEPSEFNTVLKTKLEDVNTEDKLFLLSETDYINTNYFGPVPNPNITINTPFWLRSASLTKEFIYSVCQLGNLRLGLESNYFAVRPAFWLDWNNVIFASAIKDDAGENPTITPSGNGYEASDGEGNNLKLTIINDEIGSLSGLPALGDTYSGLGLEVNGADIKINSGDISSYSIAYKIINADTEEMVGYNNIPAASNFVIETYDLYKDAVSEPASLENGDYKVYVWLQKNNPATSNEATTPFEIDLTVKDAPDEPIHIISIGEVNVTTTVGNAPILPDEVSVLYSDYTVGSERVIWRWDEISSEFYETPNNFTVNGYIESTDDPVVANVSVVSQEKTIITIVGARFVEIRARENARFYAYASNGQNITWSSSNPNTATISEDGYLEAKKPGTVLIIATADDGTCEAILVRIIAS